LDFTAGERAIEFNCIRYWHSAGLAREFWKQGTVTDWLSWEFCLGTRIGMGDVELVQLVYVCPLSLLDYNIIFNLPAYIIFSTCRATMTFTGLIYKLTHKVEGITP